MAHHDSTPASVLNAPQGPTVVTVHAHPARVVKGQLIRTGRWTPYRAPADRAKRRGKKAARHLARAQRRAVS